MWLTSAQHSGVAGVDGGVPELEGEVFRSVVMLGVELALSVFAPTVSPVFMMLTLYPKSLIYCSRRSWSFGVVVWIIKRTIRLRKTVFTSEERSLFG